MKPFFDDPRWEELVDRTILSPEFAEAWETLKGSGIGSTESTKRVADLIRDSDWHISRLEEQRATILEAYADSELAAREFDRVLREELLIVATAHMIMGIMLGTTLTVRRLAKDIMEALEEEKPLVN
jgi:hypothetical protein